jgi:hypothetical protein
MVRMADAAGCGGSMELNRFRRQFNDVEDACALESSALSENYLSKIAHTQSFNDFCINSSTEQHGPAPS